MTRTWTTPVLLGCLAAVCACALSGVPAFAAPTCDTSWAGGDGAWATAANWTNGVPTAITDACIDAGAGDTVTVTGTARAQALTLAKGRLAMDAAAKLTVGGDYSQDAATTLAVEVDTGSSSQVIVVGNAALAGTLDVTTAGAEPQGTSFDVVQAATVAGTFDPVSFTGQRHTVDYGASAVTLTPIQPPANSSPPKVFGTPEFGERLHCNEGGWTNDPSAYAYTWKRDGTEIVNAHDVDYQASFVDVGHRLSCAVVAFNPLASDPADSEALLIPGAPAPKTTTTTAVPPAFAQPDTFSPGFAGAPGSATALTPAAPVPVALRSGSLEPAEGDVLVRLPGSDARVRVAAVTSLPVGAVVDTIHGVARLVVAKDFAGGVQRGRFARGTFYYRQGVEPVRVRHKLFRALVTRLVLAGGGSVKSCAKGGAGFTRVLDAWGNGRFRVVGRFSSARGSGARWVTRDDCSGTRTTVLQGSVVVTDFPARRTFVLTAGHHHVATGRR